MKNYWMIRPFPNSKPRFKEFLEDNIIAVGCRLLGNLSNKDKSAIKQMIAQEYGYSSYKLGRKLIIANSIANGMHIGDIVVVPDGEDILYGEISSDYFFNPTLIDENTGYPHQREVVWLKQGYRKDMPKELRASLIQSTIANLSHHADVIDSLIQGEKMVFTNNISELTLKYPLRSNYVVSITVPSDILKSEAERLAESISTLHSFEK